MRKIPMYASLIMLFALATGCVGTDYIDDPIIGEKLRIIPFIDSLVLGQKQVFEVQYTNKYGQESPASAITWSSSAPSIIRIDATGTAEALAAGAATLYASNGVLVDSIRINRNSSGGDGGGGMNMSDTSFFKQGVFKPAGTHYNAKGNVFVQTINGVSQIRTASNFGTSAGPSLYLLLTNHKNGSYSVTPGGHVVNAVSAQITANKLSVFSGEITWDVPANVDLADYKYVVLYCTLGPVFGTADLE